MRQGYGHAKAAFVHALTVIDERQIAIEWVEQTVRSPQWQEFDPGNLEVLRLFGHCLRRVADSSESLV